MPAAALSPVAAGLVQLAVLLALLAVVYVPFGDHLAAVYTGERHWRVERLVYRVVRVDPDSEQRWTGYAGAVLAFSFLSIVLLHLLQRLQGLLPLSLDRGAVEPGIAFNTAVSFVTNTNWQSYAPETAMGHLVQMAGLTVQNFVSAAVGMAVAVVLVRGFVRAGTDRVGNFWVDLTRGVVRVLLPVSFVAAIVLVALGVTMSLRAGVDVTGVDGEPSTIALAPAAAQEAVKELGTNGGGIFNANSAHPFENPDGLTNVLQVFLVLLIPVCLTRAFGVMVRDTRQGRVLLAVMGALWGGLLAVAWWAETHPNGPAALLAGAAMEGKEVRFGIGSSVLFAVSTTGTSTGAVNSLHDSYTGLGGGVALLGMLLGEVAPGGVGAGLYGILVLAVIAVFLAGLMVGRTPEYLGKKLGRVQVTAASVAILAMPALVLLGTGAALAQPAELDAALTGSGAHGLSEVLYAYASAANNNGSAFAGLTATSPFFQSTLGIAMLLGRFVPILAVLALAGSLAAQRRVEPGAGTLPTHGPLFGSLVGGTVLLVAALTFFPALALGPLAEALA
jgi:potassium-transporting ATPase potassium-binding subunit